MQATVPALPNPPLQWTTTLLPSRSSLQRDSSNFFHFWRKDVLGGLPSTIGSPYQ